MNGTDLLAEFRESRSEKAFGELVRLYTNLVYSVAKRRLSNVSLAQEVTQIVFIRLAKAVPKIRGDAELVAWLHRTTVHVSIDLWRSESRRRAREQHVAAMEPDHTEESASVWNDIAPVLDEALNDLEDTERQVILLRFFEQKSMRDLGSHFGISEDAAKMRVSRAMDKLRSRLGGIGATCTAAALGTMLAERSVEAAPVELTSALAMLQVPVSAGIGGGLASLLAEGAKMKVVASVAATVLISGAVLVLVHSLQNGKNASPRDRAQASASNEASEADGADVSGTVSNAVGAMQSAPNPRKLLQGVARARQRIISGEMEFTAASYEFNRPFEGTNVVQVKGVFDDSKFRFESFGREYRYTSMEPNVREVTDAKMRTEGLNQQDAVKAGLLQGFDSHHVTVYDGSALMHYWETDNGYPTTEINDLRKGGGGYIFDPRTLGLSTWLSADRTTEGCLGYAGAKSLQLIGKEAVGGVPCWHVHVQSSYNDSFDFWMDAEHPTRVLKHAYGESTALSKYDENDSKNPIPSEVQTTVSYNGNPRDQRTIICTGTKFNVPIAPISWTLAGLGMKVGTEVNDNRIHRRIGYWSGSGLSENLPSTTGETKKAPEREELLALLDVDPASVAALDAAHWIMLNTPDGPEVEKAGEVILRDHIESTNLLNLSQELERMRHTCSRKLLEAMMEKNPVTDIRGNACFTLATLQKDAAHYGSNAVATVEAVKLFERVIADFGQVKRNNGYALAELAKPELLELQRLVIGKAAPKTEGEDLDGQPIKLSDYRGKVVAVLFWGHCGGCRPEMRPLLDTQERLAGKPFAILGVYTDNHPDEAKAIAEELGMTWRSFKEDRDGPISVGWNMHRWPNIWVLDGKGVIRHRDVRPEQLEAVAEALMSGSGN